MLNTSHGTALNSGWLQAILSEDAFRPTEPASMSELGLPPMLVESLVLKRLSLSGSSTGRQMAEDLCLPFNILSDVLASLRSRQLIVHKGSAPLGDYLYVLTDTGQQAAQQAIRACAYSGPAPVPLSDYVISVEAQTIRAEAPRRTQLRSAFADITIDEKMFEKLGPAINSGAGLFLFGDPGNGKSTLAKRITMCFGQQVWIPHAIFEDSHIIKLYDLSVHVPCENDESGLIQQGAFDRRWIKVRRPTVVVGGELTLDALEIRYDPLSRVCEAPLQMKSNAGCLLVDDFGRQRIEPVELLNRWIVPLENRIDYLTLPSGKKISVPFEQLIIFSTNLQPDDLVDEAFLRRIPYKIEVGDPSIDEFHQLFQSYCEKFDCHYRADVIDRLIQRHYVPGNRPLRRCHPRDLLAQIHSLCRYNDVPMELCDEYFDRVVGTYFSMVLGARRIDRRRRPQAPQYAADCEMDTPAPIAPPAPGGTLLPPGPACSSSQAVIR